VGKGIEEAIRKTYYFIVQASSVSSLDDCMIKIVRVALVAVLQRMKEIQEIECKCC
jgi:hypothetical protein